MIKFIIIGVLVLSAIALIVLIVKCIKGKKFLIRQFDRCNCIVFGKKGTGKDLLFNAVINGRKKPCYANIPYNEKFCEVRQIKDFSVSPNTYENFLNDDIKVIDKTLEENKDYYISDGGFVLCLVLLQLFVSLLRQRKGCCRRLFLNFFCCLV